MRRRHYVTVVLAVYTVLLLTALLAPNSTAQSSIFVWLSRMLGALGAPASLVDLGHLEALSNVAVIAPVTALGSLLCPSRRWTEWTAYGFVASASIELIQAVALPGRDGAFIDVVANTLGALLGAGVGTLLHRSQQLLMP